MSDNFLDGIDLGQLQAYLGGSAKAAAQGNQAEGQYLNARDAIKAQLYNTASQAATAGNTNALNTAKFTTSLPGEGASEAVRGSLIKNVQDVHSEAGVPGLTTSGPTGGSRPSDLTPEARQAGSDLIAHGQSLIANPNSFVPPPQAATAPTLEAEPSAGFWGQAAGAGSSIAGILSALSGKAGTPGSGTPSGGDLGKIINWLKNGGKDDPNVASEADSPQHQEEADPTDMSSSSSGVAIDPATGLPLPNDTGGAYYDDGSGQMMGGGGTSGGDWWSGE